MDKGGPMNVIGVIPARFGSTRFPGKPLKLIAGKPLLQWVIEGAKTSREINQVIVATDHKEILALAKSCGVEGVMTDSNLPSGTDRAWAALNNSTATKNIDADVVLNIQGDEPLISAEILNPLINLMKQNKHLQMGTLAHVFDSEQDMQSENTAKIVLNKNNEAIYFSRFAIPFSRNNQTRNSRTRDKNITSANLQHIGIYAYRKSFLKEFCESGQCEIEKNEGLEQLRAIYLGAKIGVVTVNYKTHGVDTPEDIKKIEILLKNYTDKKRGQAHV